MNALDVLVRIPKALIAQLTEAKQMPDFLLGRTGGWRETEEFMHTSIQMDYGEFRDAVAAYVPPVSIIGVWDWETGRQYGAAYDDDGNLVAPGSEFPFKVSGYLTAMPDVPSGGTKEVEVEEPVMEEVQTGTKEVVVSTDADGRPTWGTEPVYERQQTGTRTVTMTVPDGVLVRPETLSDVVLFAGQAPRDLTFFGPMPAPGG